MSQLRGEILRQRKNNAIKQNINVVSTQSDSEEEINNDNIETDHTELIDQWNTIIGDWLNLLDDEEFENEEIEITNHPATNQDAK